MSYATLFVRRIPEDVKVRFVGTCHSRGDTIQAVIEALMRQYNHDPRLADLSLVRHPEPGGAK